MLNWCNYSISARSQAPTLTESPIGTCLVTLRAHTHVRTLCIHTLSSSEAEVAFQTFVNVCKKKKKVTAIIQTVHVSPM